jgi:hypothetical protein
MSVTPKAIHSDRIGTIGAKSASRPNRSPADTSPTQTLSGHQSSPISLNTVQGSLLMYKIEQDNLGPRDENCLAC